MIGGLAETLEKFELCQQGGWSWVVAGICSLTRSAGFCASSACDWSNVFPSLVRPWTLGWGSMVLDAALAAMLEKGKKERSQLYAARTSPISVAKSYVS